VLAREQHLTQLDGLAAAAAHELGTPLSTIVLVSRELEKALADGTQTNFQASSQVAGDIKTLREQAQRCRDILSKITQLSSTGAPFDRMKLSTLIEETVAPHRDFGVDIKVRIAVAGSREPVGSRNPAVLYGVGNILKRIGEPYLSRRRVADDTPGEHSGLGLGVFIARTLLERTGAKISFSNRIFPDHGAVVQIDWPRDRFEASETDETPMS